MLRDSFDPNTWYYLYEFQPGRGDKERKELTLNFVGDRLATVTGDFLLQRPSPHRSGDITKPASRRFCFLWPR
jgi:outer membrane protein assembly factor BamE (lipoprotein component of BamABCDE complex)